MTNEVTLDNIFRLINFRKRTDNPGLRVRTLRHFTEAHEALTYFTTAFKLEESSKWSERFVLYDGRSLSLVEVKKAELKRNNVDLNRD